MQEPLFTLRGHGRPKPSGCMSILPSKDGVRFLFERPRDMAIACIAGLPHAIVHLKQDDSTIYVNLVSASDWRASWDAEGATKVSVQEFLERCGVTFGSSWSTSASSNINSSGGAADSASSRGTGDRADTRRGDPNNPDANRGSNDGAGGSQPPPLSPLSSQPSSVGGLPGNRVRIIVTLQNEAGADLEADTALQLAAELQAECGLQGKLDFLITREENVHPPLLDLELAISADFMLRSVAMVRERDDRSYRVGVLHDQLKMEYHADTRSALSLDKARAIELSILEMNTKKSRSTSVSTEVGGELNLMVVGQAPPATLTGVAKVSAKRMKLRSDAHEVSKLRKMDALPNSSFTVDYRCHRPLNGPDVLRFVAPHYPPLVSLASFDDSGLMPKEGAEIFTSLGKSMGMSVVGEFWMEPGLIHTHTFRLSRMLGEFEVTPKTSFFRRVTRMKAKMESALVEGSQSFKVELLFNHGFDFDLYGGQRFVWVAKSFVTPAADLIDFVPPPPPPPVPSAT